MEQSLLLVWLFLQTSLFASFLPHTLMSTSRWWSFRMVLVAGSLVCTILLPVSALHDVIALLLTLYGLVIVIPGWLAVSRVDGLLPIRYSFGAKKFMLLVHLLFWVRIFWEEHFVVVNVTELMVGWISLSASLLGLSMLVRLAYKIMKIRFRPNTEHSIATGKLPSVTLAIPARNETHALSACLTSAIASDYPKLEILVLDDCSQDNTAQIIKSFAHDGVRFVQGVSVVDAWLGKNKALQTLLDHSSGEYVLFMGVDVQLDPQSILLFMQRILLDKAEYASVIPYNENRDLLATFLRPLRYTRLLLSRVSSTSAFWVMKRASLEDMGGFRSIRNAIEPERLLGKRSTGSRFYMSTRHLGITTRKRASSQFDTAVRTLFPLAGRSHFIVFLALAFIVLVLLLPLYYAYFALLDRTLAASVRWLYVSPLIIFTVLQMVVLRLLNPPLWYVGILSFPITLLVEAVALIWSTIQYASGRQKWKGRNVCLPALESIDRLPDAG